MMQINLTNLENGGLISNTWRARQIQRAGKNTVHYHEVVHKASGLLRRMVAISGWANQKRLYVHNK